MGLMGEIIGLLCRETRRPCPRPVARSDGVAVSLSTLLGTAARPKMTHTHAHAHTMHDARTTLHDSTQQPTTIQDRGGG